MANVQADEVRFDESPSANAEASGAELVRQLVDQSTWLTGGKRSASSGNHHRREPRPATDGRAPRRQLISVVHGFYIRPKGLR